MACDRIDLFFKKRFRNCKGGLLSGEVRLFLFCLISNIALCCFWLNAHQEEGGDQ